MELWVLFNWPFTLSFVKRDLAPQMGVMWNISCQLAHKSQLAIAENLTRENKNKNTVVKSREEIFSLFKI